MAIDPTCSHCRRKLTLIEGNDNTACLAIDRLACQKDLHIVRAYARAESPLSVVTESRGAQ